MAESAVLRIDGALDVSGVAQRAPLADAALRSLAAIDLSGVTGLDSAGVAYVRVLQARAAALNARKPALHGAPPRFSQLCVAHRIDCGTD